MKVSADSARANISLGQVDDSHAPQDALIAEFLRQAAREMARLELNRHLVTRAASLSSTERCPRVRSPFVDTRSRSTVTLGRWNSVAASSRT